MASRPGDSGQSGGEGVPPMAAVLLIGNLFVLVGLLLVDSTVIRIVLLLVAAAMLGGGILILSRHAARLKAIHGGTGADDASVEEQVRDGDA